MPWQEASTVSLRREFVILAERSRNKAALCRRFEISRKTGYKWLERFLRAGVAGLEDRPRRPKSSPKRTPPQMASRVLETHDQYPGWGGRKIHRRLRDVGVSGVPCPSTITEILRRHGRLDEAESAKHKAFRRFEHPESNDLWQMDFKGHFALSQGRCHPLTVLDDHSRFSVGLQACGDELGSTVRAQLIGIFRRYGLPRRMLVDNGSPWGSDPQHPHTPLTAWLMRLGVEVSHSRPYHPQTLGKDERFHRTLKLELLSRRSFRDLEHCQRDFDIWRDTYNLERPHDSLGLVW